MTSVTVDPSTGHEVFTTDYQMLVTLFDDSVYLGIMVMVYDYTGVNRFFLSLPDVMATNPYVMQALRYGVMFGSMIELRRWLTTWGVPTDTSVLLNKLFGSITDMHKSVSG